MNTEESDRELQRRLEKLEIELNAQPNTRINAAETQKQPAEKATSVSTSLNKFINLFNGLPNAGKIIVGGVGIIFGFAILRTLLSLVASLFSLAFLGLLVYGMYQFLLSRSQRAK